MIKTLKLNKMARNLTLIAAGAFMATLVVIPFTTSADEEGNDPIFSIQESQSTFVIQSDDGLSSRFTLVENDGQMVLALIPEAPPVVVDRSNDDDFFDDD